MMLSNCMGCYIWNWLFMGLLFLCLISLNFRKQKEPESEVEAKTAELQTNLETVAEETEGTNCQPKFTKAPWSCRIWPTLFLKHSLMSFVENPEQSDTTSPVPPAIIKKEGETFWSHSVVSNPTHLTYYNVCKHHKSSIELNVFPPSQTLDRHLLLISVSPQLWYYLIIGTWVIQTAQRWMTINCNCNSLCTNGTKCSPL